MAYNVTSSTYRTTHSPNSRNDTQQHIYEEQPYYANERPISRQSFGGDSRRTGGVRIRLHFFTDRRKNVKWNLSQQETDTMSQTQLLNEVFYEDENQSSTHENI